MKKIFIHAYTAGNLGDDLMVRILCERYPNVKFWICADESYKERYADIGNLKIYTPSGRFVRCTDRLVRKIKKTENGAQKLLVKAADAVVHIGGSVFVQHQDDFGAALELDRRLQRLSRHMFVVGANFGPYTDPEYVKQYRDLFAGYADICFRDTHSKKLFADSENIRYAPDVVFNYSMTDKIEEKKQVLFSVIRVSDRGGKYSISPYSDDYTKFLLGLMERFLENGYRLKLISFCRMQGDDEMIGELIRHFDESSRRMIGICSYDMDEKECIRAFCESEIVVGTRFHSIILGKMAQKKVFSVVYDQKTLRTLQDWGCTEYLKMEDLWRADLDELASRIMEMEPETKSWKKEASGQFKALDAFLGNGEGKEWKDR